MNLQAPRFHPKILFFILLQEKIPLISDDLRVSKVNDFSKNYYVNKIFKRLSVCVIILSGVGKNETVPVWKIENPLIIYIHEPA